MKLVFSILLFVSCLMMNGQMAFRNKTNVTIRMVFAYYTETKEYSGWITEGWYELKPGETVKVMNTPLDNEYYYYYASSVDSSVEFKGEILLKVGSGTFKMKNANQNVSFKKDSYRYFKQIDTNDKKNFTVVLHENYVEEE